jgi:hypothetical protein
MSLVRKNAKKLVMRRPLGETSLGAKGPTGRQTVIESLRTKIWNFNISSGRFGSLRAARRAASAEPRH